MEMVEDVVIVGAGIAGLTTALGLHRLGIRSLVLESSERLRITGFAFTTWNNAWRALDAVGVGESLRQKHYLLTSLIVASTFSDKPISEVSFKGQEIRCLQRRSLLETLAKELPDGTIRFSSKVVSIDDSSAYSKRLHLADGTIIKTKVLIGCDGVNSVVSKWLGLKQPCFTGRSAIRGTASFEGGHGFGQKFRQFIGSGVRAGFLPYDDENVYWFFTWSPSNKASASAAASTGSLFLQLFSAGAWPVLKPDFRPLSFSVIVTISLIFIASSFSSISFQSFPFSFNTSSLGLASPKGFGRRGVIGQRYRAWLKNKLWPRPTTTSSSTAGLLLFLSPVI